MGGITGVDWLTSGKNDAYHGTPDDLHLGNAKRGDQSEVGGPQRPGGFDQRGCLPCFMTLKDYARATRNGCDYLGAPVSNPHHVEGSNRVGAPGQSSAGGDESDRQRGEGMNAAWDMAAWGMASLGIAILGMEEKGIVTACAHGFSRSQGIAIFGRDIHGRQIRGRDKGLGEHASAGVFYRNRFRIAGLRVAFRVAIDPLDGLLDRGTVGKALLSDISWHIPVGYALGALRPRGFANILAETAVIKGAASPRNALEDKR